MGSSFAQADVARSIPWFPVVGGLVGLAVAGTYAAAMLVLPPLVAAAGAVGTGVGLTGAFHEDGLADSADALGAWDKHEARRILKDPGHGTYGIVVIVLSLVLRIGALASLGAWAGLAVLTAANALGRAAAFGLVAVIPAASEEGLGASIAAAASRRIVLVTLAVGLAIGVVTLGAWVLPAAALAGIGTWIVGALAIRKIGGVTGDVLGAAEQTSEILTLVLGAAVAARGWPGLPWWR